MQQSRTSTSNACTLLTSRSAVATGSAKVLRRSGARTVSDPEFYQRFYALVSQLAAEDARKVVGK